MAWTPTKTIGLAFYEGRILAAEMSVSGPRRIVSGMAEFSFPENLDPGDRVALGKALAQFLRAQKLTARQAVIGLPVHRILTRQQAVPPAQGDVLSGILRIQAERAFSYDGKALSVDYIPQEAEGPKRTVTLFAALRETVDQALAVAQAAGLTVRGITSSAAALALAGATDEESSLDLVLQVIPGSVELAVQSRRKLRAVRHVPVSALPAESPAGWLDMLTSELRRVMATASAELGGAGGRLVVWDGVGLPPDAAAKMGERLSADAGEFRDLSSLAETNGTFESGPETSRFAAAVALARSAVDPRLLAVDFLHSRLAPPRRARFNLQSRILIGVGAILLAVLAVMGVDWYTTSGAVRSLQREIAELAPDAKAAETLIQEVESANGWFGTRPRTLECLLQLSRLFPEDGRIWATELILPDDMRGILSGKATEDRVVLDVFNRLQESPEFADVKLHGGIRYPRESSRDRDLSFSISFRFKGSR